MMIFTGKEITEDRRENADVCVIGSGAGGSVAAAELAEGGLDVVLLEEGGYYPSKEFNSNPSEMLPKLYRDGGASFILGSPGIAFSEGRCVGGGTVTNGALCWRLPDKVLKRWNWEHGLKDITPSELNPFFEKVEKSINVAHQKPESIAKGDYMFKEAAESLGYKVVNQNRNQKNCVGLNQCILGCPKDRKQSTLITYIPRALEKGTKLFADSRAIKIMKSNGVFTVKANVLDRETAKPRRKLTVTSKLVVLACGAIQTPVLLIGSRLGNSSGQVGRNFYCHPNVKTLAFFDKDIYYWKGAHQAFKIVDFLDAGLIIATGGVHPAIIAMTLPYFGRKHLEFMEQYNRMIGAGALIEDTTSGRVIRAPGGTPLMFYNIDKIGFERMRLGVALLSEIMFAAGARKILLPFLYLDEISSPDEIKKIYNPSIRPKQTESLTVHAMGTCRMGTDPARSVVNQWGESHDMKGLFIADASVIPTPIGVNPMLTIMALASRSAQYILDNKRTLNLI